MGKKILGEGWDVYSAGIEAHGVNPKAVKAMKEVNIDITNQTSDIINQDILKRADLVVTLCGHANDVCPATPKTKSESTGDLMIRPKLKEQKMRGGLFSNVFVTRLGTVLRNLRKQVNKTI